MDGDSARTAKDATISSTPARGGAASEETVPPGRVRPRLVLDEPDCDRVVQKAIAAAKRGDSDAIGCLYVRYRDNVYGYLRSIVRDEHEAEDVTQQVFMKLMGAIHQYEPRGVPFSAWILRVARNAGLDHLRQRRLVPVEEVFPSETPTRAAGDRETALTDALSALPDDQRAVLILRHVAGLSPGEIATHLGRSEGSIHGLHHRGRGRLKLELTRLGSGPITRQPSPALAAA